MKLAWGLRWWELLPEVVVGAGLSLFFVLETSAATSAFKSTTAIVVMVLAGAVWLAVRLLLVRFSVLPLLRLAVLAVAAAGVLGVVVWPAFDDTTVVETIPVATGAVQSSPTVPLPETGQSPRASQLPPAVELPAMAATTPVEAPTRPVAVRRAALRGIDHRASGMAVVYRQPDASLVIGLEGIDIQPGPDYDLYVVPGADRRAPGGGTRLGDLRGNKGTQYYAVPQGTDVAVGEWTVLVWCQTFDVPVASATPA